MKQKDLAAFSGRTVPAVISLQRKYGLTAYDDYSEGYAVLLTKIMNLAVFSVPAADIKALLKDERSLLELLNVDSLHDSPDWFESLCCMSIGPTRLLLTGYDIGHEVSGNTVQTGLDFRERSRELFEDSQMGADALVGMKKYAGTLERIRGRLADERELVDEALGWCQQVLK